MPSSPRRFHPLRRLRTAFSISPPTSPPATSTSLRLPTSAKCSSAASGTYIHPLLSSPSTNTSTLAPESSPSSPSNGSSSPFLLNFASSPTYPFSLRRQKSLAEMEMEEEKRSVSGSLVSVVEPRPYMTSKGAEQARKEGNDATSNLRVVGDKDLEVLLFGGIEEVLFA